jgi:small subunit ribosomal protein S6
LDSNRYGRDPGGVSGKIGETIEAAGGKMLASRLWSEQKLAYPINGHRKGTYWLTYFELSTDQLEGINRQFKLNDAVLRNLVLSVDERIADTLVQHAVQGSKPAVRSTTAGEGTEPTKPAASAAT